MAASRSPVLLQAKNDADTAPTYALAKVLEHARIPHEARIFPPFGGTVRSGHAGFCNRAQEVWGPAAMAFLESSFEPWDN